jgi:cytosine/adenosine deaminase-related metal-dependent hydrolase
MASRSTLVQHLPGLVNAHAHGTYGPQYRGVKSSAPFDEAGVNLMARETHAPRPDEFHACALVTGCENLRAGNTAIIDHYYGPLTREHVYAVAGAYEQVGIRAWVLVEFSDLPWLLYTREAYPGFARAVPKSRLPLELQDLIKSQPAGRASDVENVVGLIAAWSGRHARIGLALGNPLWCSDELIRAVAAAARRLDVPLTTHVEESALQREVSLAEWGLSGVERMRRCGALGDRTVISHAVHIDESDVSVLAETRTSIAHNPVSNLKLQVGVAQVGEWVRNGVNVCLGSDGQASGDSQNLFTVMKFTAALADLNGLRAAVADPEATVLAMATTNASRYWGDQARSRDVVEFTEPLGPTAHAWDDPAGYIGEVYVDGELRLARCRELLETTRANDVVIKLRRTATAARQVARAERLTELVRPFVSGRPVSAATAVAERAL